MEDCKPVITPMQTSCKLREDDDSKSTDLRQYRSMIGSLLYVTASRPNVMQAVRQVARFEAAPKESHVLAVKRIFRYLKGTEEFGLWYPKGKDLSLIAYTDVLEHNPNLHQFIPSLDSQILVNTFHHTLFHLGHIQKKGASSLDFKENY